LSRATLVTALAKGLPQALAADLADNFLSLRQDAATGTLGRASPGKFVETVVQSLQFLDCGKYDAKPDVDAFLRAVESRPGLDDGLRICCARIARAMYSLRSKRNILHKGDVDPNSYDLRFLHHGSQWVVAEFVRAVSGLSMEECGKLIDLVQAPVGGLVEDFGGRKLVLQEMSTREEILVLLHSEYPEALPVDQIVKCIDRRHEETVRRKVRSLWESRLLEGGAVDGYRLTVRGFSEAATVVTKYLA